MRKTSRARPGDTPDQARLRELIWQSGMTRARAAEALGVSVHTIHNWLKPADNASYRPIPARMLKFAGLVLGSDS